MSIRIIITDDHPIVRTGLEIIINEQEDMEVVATAANGIDAFELAEQLNPDIILMDINMPPGESGLVTTQRIIKAFPAIKVIILTMYDDKEYINKLLEVGASGYVLKSSKEEELLQAIRSVEQGDAFLSPKATKILIEKITSFNTNNSEETRISVLTDREKEILSLFVHGYTNKEISEKLFISTKTIESHKYKIMNKLEINKKRDLITFALNNGIL